MNVNQDVFRETFDIISFLSCYNEDIRSLLERESWMSTQHFEDDYFNILSTRKIKMKDNSHLKCCCFIKKRLIKQLAIILVCLEFILTRREFPERFEFKKEEDSEDEVSEQEAICAEMINSEFSLDIFEPRCVKKQEVVEEIKKAIAFDNNDSFKCENNIRRIIYEKNKIRESFVKVYWKDRSLLSEIDSFQANVKDISESAMVLGIGLFQFNKSIVNSLKYVKDSSSDDGE